jgi:hypothetical protein
MADSTFLSLVGSFGSTFDTAQGINSDGSFSQNRSAETTPTNALQSMQPIVDDTGESWSGFWRDLTKGVVNYAVAKDLAKTSAELQTKPVPGTAPTALPSGGFSIPPGLIVLALAGGALVLAIKVLR